MVVSGVSSGETERGSIPPGQDDPRGRCRLAIISTPRSGNTWVRMQLAALYGLEQIPVHDPGEIDWHNLPERCVIQIHYWPVQDFLNQLAAHEVRVVVLARHPLDVLMSWLNLAYYKHQDGRCPGHGACTECGIATASPASDAFLEYARSESTRTLLCHSPAWWFHPGIVRARYEDLVADPEAALRRLAEDLNEPTVRAIADVAAEHSMRHMQTHAEVWRFQCWQGQSELWRHLLPAPAARAVRENVPEAFDFLGYACDPDETLTPLQAELNWARLQLDSARAHLIRACQKQDRAASEAWNSGQALESARAELRAERQGHEETRRALAAAEERLPRPGVIWRIESARLHRPLAILSRYLRPSKARRSMAAPEGSEKAPSR